MLLGRATETAHIEGLLAAATEGTSGTLVLVGEVGVGKTALLDHAVLVAGTLGFLVLRATGVEAESTLPYAVLDGLLRPILALAASLPAAQADALRGALALGPGDAGDAFRTAAATLGLLAAAAEEQPVLVVVDDLHWVDPGSAGALAFAARRLEAEGVVVLAAGRPDDLPERLGLPERRLEGLDLEAARELLARGASRPPPASVTARLHEATGGNPLALLELPAVLPLGRLAGHDSLVEPLPIGRRLEQAYRERLSELPPETRHALLVAAASGTGDAGAVAAASGLDALPAALEPAEAGGLVTLGRGRIGFRHPLVRSAVYAAADPAERRRVHARLAAVLDGPADEERRAWHLAAAAVEPDEATAEALERAARSARARGGQAAEAHALEVAADLTPDAAVRARRRLAAAHAVRHAGDLEHALVLLRAVADDGPEAAVRAEGAREAAMVELWLGRDPRAYEGLVAGAEALAAERPAEAAALLLRIASYRLLALDARGAVDAARRAAAHLEAADEDPLGPAGPTLALALTLSGAPEGPLLASQAAGLLERRGWAGGAPLVARCLVWSEAFGSARRLVEAAVDADRAASELWNLPADLVVLAELELRVGHVAASEAAASEAVRLLEDTGQELPRAFALAALARAEALHGAEEPCRRHAAQARAIAADAGLEAAEAAAQAALGALALAHGRADEATDALAPVAAFLDRSGVGHPAALPVRCDLAEAHARAGRRESAAREAATLEAQAVETGARLAEGAALRVQGLLAEDDAFEERFATALALHDEAASPLERGRTELCLGERLRRAGRRVDARERLRSALDAFERCGAAPWADRARAELRASGESRRRRDASAGEELTPQELQIAQMVAQGATNREAAAALFLSPKTIEVHLSRVYRKLGVRSRTELASRLAGPGGSVSAA